MANVNEEKRWWLIVLASDDQPFGVRDTEASARNYADNLSRKSSVVEVVPAEALREAKTAHEKADAENRMLRAFIDRGEYQEDVAALLTVNRCSYCGDLVGSDPTLCGPCGGEADMERDEALEAAREAKAEVARLGEALKRLLDVALVDGYGETVRDDVEALLGSESEPKTGGHEMSDAGKEPVRGELPPDMLKAARKVSTHVWRQPYVSGEGPMHYAGGPYWRGELLRRAAHFERLAAACRVCAEWLPPVSPESGLDGDGR